MSNPPTIPVPRETESKFRAMLNTLRAGLNDEENCLYFLHTATNVINVTKWVHIPNFVIVMGENEAKEFKLFVFSNEQIHSFPLEVRRKSGVKTDIGFKPVSS